MIVGDNDRGHGALAAALLMSDIGAWEELAMKQAVRVAAAQEMVLGCVQPVGVEKVALLEALHRVTAEEVTAQRHIPLDDNSAMDGYAVRHADVAGARRGRPAGVAGVESPPARQRPHRCVTPRTPGQIKQGAPPAEGADTPVAVGATHAG